MIHVPSWVVQALNRSTIALARSLNSDIGVSIAVQAAADSEEVSVALYLLR